MGSYSNANRVVPIWNSLPNDVVMHADNVNLFKKRLGTFLLMKDFVYIELSHLKQEV